MRATRVAAGDRRDVAAGGGDGARCGSITRDQAGASSGGGRGGAGQRRRRRAAAAARVGGGGPRRRRAAGRRAAPARRHAAARRQRRAAAAATARRHRRCAAGGGRERRPLAGRGGTAAWRQRGGAAGRGAAAAAAAGVRAGRGGAAGRGGPARRRGGHGRGRRVAAAPVADLRLPGDLPPGLRRRRQDLLEQLRGGVRRRRGRAHGRVRDRMPEQRRLRPLPPTASAPAAAPACPDRAGAAHDQLPHAVPDSRSPVRASAGKCTADRRAGGAAAVR